MEESKKPMFGQAQKEQEITFEVMEQLTVLSVNDKGWSKEVNVISWNGGEPKCDIRSWSPDHTKMSKGTTLSEQEFSNLVRFIKGNY